MEKITVEFLRQRLAEFRQQELTAIRQLEAVGGAIQFCEFLINELEKGGGEMPPPEDASHASE